MEVRDEFFHAEISCDGVDGHVVRGHSGDGGEDVHIGVLIDGEDGGVF